MTNWGDRIEQVRFADGSTLSHEQLVQMSFAKNGGNDTFYGSYDGETIDGGAGNDTIIAGHGNDRIIGGSGSDTLTGGGGNDTFAFSIGDFGGLTPTTCDRITDFASGQDRIDLSAVDADALLSGDQAFSFIGTNAFSNVAGRLRYEQGSGNSFVYGDADGDGLADFMIRVDGSYTFTANDFGL